MKVAFATLGCRVNQYESEAMAEKFIREGYEVVDFDQFSDVYVINTCTVTNMGDKKSRQIISRARRTNPEAIIAAVGCYSQMSPKEVSEIPGVDVVLGTRNKGDVVYYVNKAKDEGKSQVHVQGVLQNKVFEDLKIEDYQDKTRAFLKIQDGCNRFCTYCTIPYARGSVCSKDPNKVLSEVRELAKNGFKEVILSGIHTASYGLDLEGNVNLISIIEEIEKIDGIERIRIGSIEPAFFTPEVIEKIKSFKKLCPHFHLSLQSGCDATLKRMNRRYTAKEYEDSVNLLRETLPDVSISTDVIVGFPGETEEEFEETLSLCEEVRYDSAFTFLYSVRKGTPAAEYTNQIPEDIKHQRFNRLVDVINRISAEKNAEYVGIVEKVLVDGPSKTNSRTYGGRTETFKLVNFRGSPEMIGKIVDVRITASNTFSLEGEVVSE